MKKQRKKYSKPRRPFDKVRIDEENILKEKYGLKNKREIWKADAAIGRIRNLAKQLITKPEEEQKAFVERLQKKGFQVESIADSLALDKEDWLKRRLQTIVYSKKLTTTAKQARQFVTHKHVVVGKRIINIPSYQVSLEEEPNIKLNIVLKTQKPKTKTEEIKEQVKENSEDKKEETKIEEVKPVTEKPIKNKPVEVTA
tara:strand:+ start:103 stop:699 length:597 start_codon:yes stop_codon:yes gene_type:complete